MTFCVKPYCWSAGSLLSEKILFSASRTKPSKILQTTGVRLTGLQLLGLVLSNFFKIGLSSAYLHDFGFVFFFECLVKENMIANHSVNYQLFVDDTQLQKSTLLNEVTSLTKELNACTDDIKTWLIKNQLKLNDDKTETLPFPFLSSFKSSTVSLLDSVTLGSHNIPISDSAGNLAVS